MCAYRVGCIFKLGQPPDAPAASGGDTLYIVAVGQSYSERVSSLRVLGSRVWMQASNLDAFAEGDGPLTRAPVLLATLPHEPGLESVQVVGSYPHLFARRTKDVSPTQSTETLFVFGEGDAGAGSGTWTSRDTKVGGLLVAFHSDALVMHTQFTYNDFWSSPDRPGTTLSLLKADGTISDAHVTLPKTFTAWRAESDGENVALLGVYPGPTGGEPMGAVSVVRITKACVKSTDVQKWGTMSITYGARIHEHGGKAVVVPPGSDDLQTWKPTHMSVIVVGDDGTPDTHTVPGGDGCGVVDASLVGDVLYALRRCWAMGATVDDVTTAFDLVRIDASGKAAMVPMPRLVRTGDGFRAARGDEANRALECRPQSVAVRSPNDLWVTAACGASTKLDKEDPAAVPIVLRLGRSQTPLPIP